MGYFPTSIYVQYLPNLVYFVITAHLSLGESHAQGTVATYD